MRQHAPSSTGQITTEAWAAMRDAAQRAGLPLDQWLRAQLFGSLPQENEGAGASGGIADLHRRVQDLASQIERLATLPSRALPEAPIVPPPSYAETKLDAAIRQINDRLGEIASPRPRSFETTSRAPEPRSRPSYDSLSSASFERRLSEIMGDREPPEDREPSYREPAYREPAYREPIYREPSPVEERRSTPSAIEAAVAEIAARQNELDRYPATEPAPTAPEPAPREFATRDFAPREAPPAWNREPEPAKPASRSSGKLDALQGELAEMRRSLDQLAPRKAVAELQRTVTSLAERVERSGAGDEELRATLQMLRDAIGGLRLPEHSTVINGRIDTLQRKIDLLNAKSIDGSTIARLQAQTSEIRDLLARSLSTDSVRLLAEQVAMLASKLTAMSGAHENMMRSLVSPLEHRIDRLADRIETHSASIPIIPVDDIFRRLDGIQHSLVTARREAPAGMEALFEGLSERIKRIERPTLPPNSVTAQQIDTLSLQIATLAEKVENAGHPSDQLVGQLSGIERTLNDLFIQVEETRATLLANNGTLPPSGSPGPQGGHQTGSSLLKREMAAIEAARAAAAASAARAQATRNAQPPAPIAAAPVAAAPVAPAPAPEDAIEPQVMRAALEALERSSALPVAAPAAPASPAAPSVPAPAPVRAAPVAETNPYMPVDLDGDVPPALDDYEQLYRKPAPAAAHEGQTPGRVDFIARARRAAQPAPAVPPSTHHHIGHRQHREAAPTPWLSRLRAMLLIGVCGSALAFASWQLIGAMRQAQLQAVAPATGVVAPTTTARMPAAGGNVAAEDITGSIGAAANATRAPAAAQAPAPAAPAPAPLAGPSSMSLPSELPGGIGTPAMRAAALAGDPAAAYEIAHRFIEGIGVPSNAVRAAEWFEYAASRGSVPAAYRLGAIYERGVDGVARDVARAKKLYEQAASAGNVRAMHNLGVLLAAGIDGQPDYRAAAEWFTRAAERGVRDSQYNLAVLYARGFGVAMDLSAAWQWFSLAAASGDSEAAIKRDEIAKKLDPKTLAAAKTTLDGWSPKLVDAAANSGSGGEPQNDAQARKTASR